MKKIIVGLLLLVATSAYAQTLADEREIIQAHFGMDKKSIVKEFVRVEGEKSTTFWDLFNQYENDRMSGSQKKYTLLNNYVTNYMRLSEKETDEIVNEIIQLTSNQNKLLASYYKKMKKSCGIITAAQFYQIEWYILSEVRTTILESIPIISELERRK